MKNRKQKMFVRIVTSFFCFTFLNETDGNFGTDFKKIKILFFLLLGIKSFFTLPLTLTLEVTELTFKRF